jgi:hypothetical protein
MTLPTLFEVCSPRQDVLEGRIAESDFAADLARVIRQDAPEEYQNPVKFFANTHPTRGLKELLASGCQRLQGSSEQIGSIFRLDTNCGGGKTHSLIALIHVVNGMEGVENVAEFIDPALAPRQKVRVAAFDGENADPTNGRLLGDGIRARTPWGELAYGLAGRDGYELLRASDEQCIAPGAETIRELFGSEPTLILMDELSIYLRKLKAKDRDRAGGQLTAFLTALFKAVESSPNAALVYTLAIGKGGKATDAYSEENQFIAAQMDELMSVSARKATLLDPTEEDETVKVLRRRLFGFIDDTQAAAIIDAYQRLWDQHRESIVQTTAADQRLEAFRSGFPLHPELIETLRDKTSTLSNFQRVRGMLRLLARTVAELWKDQPKTTYAIHLHHLNPGNESIRREIVTKLGLQQFLPAIRADVAGVEGDQPALAQEMDRQHYRGLLPYGSFVARIILFHSLAFNESLKGLTKEQLRYAILAPDLDMSFAEDAVRRFVQESAYLDDRPGAPLRFLAEANLTQLIRRQEQLIDPGRVRDELNDEIKGIFKAGGPFNLISFPGGPYDIPDDTGDGKPYLALIGYEAEAVNGDRVQVPALVERLYEEKGSSGDKRLNRNNVVFLCVDLQKKDDMRRKMERHLAIRNLIQSPTFGQLAQYQQDNLQEQKGKSQQQAAIAAQQAYRQLFYPSRARIDGSSVDLTHASIDDPNASESPGAGQKQVVRQLRESRKLRLPEDNPDAPSYIKDKTPLRRGQISTGSFRLEYYRDPNLPMLVGNDVFTKGIVQGIEAGIFVYHSGDLLWGQGDPSASIKIDENSYVYTTEFARDNDIWPPKPVEPDPPATPTIPQELSFFVGGYSGPNYNIELEGRALKYSLQENGMSRSLLDEGDAADNRQTVTPADGAWQQFAQALDALRVWSWDAEYNDPGILDGTQWSLKIRWDGKSISTHGSNAYPQQFDDLKKALSALLGGLNVDGAETSGHEDPGDSGDGGGGSTETISLNTFHAEGPLKEALNRVWEQARTASVEKLATLEIKLYNDSDAFTLMGFVRQIRSSTTHVAFEGGYSTSEESTFEFDFQGQIGDASAIKDFLAAQMRAARDKSLFATYTVEFSDGLDVTGDEPEKLTERLSRMGTGAAHVSAKAEGVR